MTEIPLNAMVEIVEGETGESTYIIVNPVNQQVTHLVVQLSHDGEITEHLIPIQLVTNTSHNRIWVQLNRDELMALPRFTTGQSLKAEQPAADQEGELTVPSGEMALHRGTTIEATDGPVGRLSALLVEPESAHISHLVIRTGALWGSKEITLPLSAVEKMAEDVIRLKLDKAGVEQLPAVPVVFSYTGEEAKVEIVAMLFETVEKAEEMLAFLKQLHGQNTLKLRNAAVMVKDAMGKVSFRETQDVDARHGALFGAITGGLIGLLGGPVGVIVGAVAGASAGGAAAKWIDMGFPDEFLKKLELGLQPGKAALVLLVEHEWLANLSEALGGVEGVILQHSLTDDMVNRLLSGEGQN